MITSSSLFQNSLRAPYLKFYIFGYFFGVPEPCLPLIIYIK